MKPSTRLPTYDPLFQAPTFEDVRALKDASGCTGNALAALVGVDGRTFRRYMAEPGTPGARQIPYAVWRLLLLELDMAALPRHPAQSGCPDSGVSVR